MNKNNTQQLSQDSKYSSRPIYGKFSLVLIVFMFVTLLPHYGKIANATTVVTAQFIIHGILYLGWYVLFAVQSRLSSTNNVTLHKKLGYLSLILVCGLTVSGTDMLIGVMRSYDDSWTAGFLLSRTSFVWAILHTLISFTGFYALGLIFRGKLHFHKRFMVLASLSMVSASVTRIAFLPFVPVDGTVVTLLSTYGFLLVPVVIDRIAFGRVHPVLKWSIPLYIVTQILCIGFLPSTEFGRAMAFPF
ncbi:hypothetical protein N9975_01825 [bacterium]|nr:hypothetical protein [bacterium]